MPETPSDRSRTSSRGSNPPGAGRPEDHSNASAQLRREPDIRPDEVKRARMLVKDPNYPPPEVIEAVAETLARRLAPRAKKS